MTKPVDQVVGLLPKLSAADLQKVSAALKMLGAKPQAVPSENQNDWLLIGIAECLVDKGLLAKANQLAKGKSYAAYLKKLPPVMEYLVVLENQCGGGRRVRTALAVMCARALADWLEARAMLEPAYMLMMVDHLPEAVEASFPGYVQAGLFGAALKGL